MKIRITRGIYGFREKGNVVEKTSSSAPFEVDDDEGNRLISLNVAEKANDPAVTGDVTQEQKTEPEEETDVLAQIGSTSKGSLEEMDKKVLCAFAEALGIKKTGSKPELVARLQQCPVWAEDTGDPAGEEMPELTAADPE